MIQKELRDAIVAVVEGNHHGRHAFIVGQIDICARTYQSFNAGVATAASRVQKRGQTAIGVILGARFRSDLAGPVVELSASIHIGALCNKDFHHLRSIASGCGGPHQRRLILHLFDGVDLRSGIDQQVEDRQVAVLDGDHQCGLTVSVRAFGSGSGSQERLHHACIALFRRFSERRRTKLVGDVHLRFFRDQRIHEVIVEAVNRPVNRTRPVGLRLIHVGSRPNHLQCRCAFAILNRGGQLPGLTLGQGWCNHGSHQNNADDETLHSLFPKCRRWPFIDQCGQHTASLEATTAETALQPWLTTSKCFCNIAVRSKRRVDHVSPTLPKTSWR